MFIESGNSDESLQDVVREYYFFSNNEETLKFVPVIDDCCYDLIFFKEANTSLIHGQSQLETQIPYHVFTIHNLKPPYKLRFEDSLNFFTIKLQPWVNAHFFGSLTESGIFNLAESNPEYIDFYSHIFTEESVENKFQKANELIGRNSYQIDKNTLLIKEICLLIYENRGIISVQEISDRFQRSRQYISKLFKQHVLYSLKKFIITVRILDLIKHRVNHPEQSLTQLSYQYNYFDQSHFIRDFKQVCGVTPSTFFGDIPKFLLRH